MADPRSRTYIEKIPPELKRELQKFRESSVTFRFDPEDIDLEGPSVIVTDITFDVGVGRIVVPLLVMKLENLRDTAQGKDRELGQYSTGMPFSFRFGKTLRIYWRDPHTTRKRLLAVLSRTLLETFLVKLDRFYIDLMAGPPDRPKKY